MNKIDDKMKEEGWHLSLFRHYYEWTAHYSHIAHVGAMGKGSTLEEAQINAIKNIPYDAVNLEELGVDW